MITLNGVRLDNPTRTYIIAEAAGSHEHNYAKAEALVRAAAEAHCDAVKFQTFTAEEIAADVPILTGYNATHDAWIARLGVTRLPELLGKGGLPRAWHAPLKALAESLGIALISTPFSVDAAKFLVEDVHVSALKIASGDLTFSPLLTYAASTGLPLIVSTGGATLAECNDALLNPLWPARDRLLFLHCASIYPAEGEMVNLRAIFAMREALGIPIGFSDHTLRIDVPAFAVAAGACCVEKHLRLHGDYDSIDARHSLDPDAFAAMVQGIRETEAILGHGRKEPHPAERHDVLWARRSPVDNLRPTEEARTGRWE